MPQKFEKISQFFSDVKGQLISKCPYEKSVSSKIPTGLPESFLGFLIYDITNQKAQKASRKPSGSYKKFQGRIPQIFSLVFWMKLIFHKDILKLTDL